jgi:AcrR family transcriptional regulator
MTRPPSTRRAGPAKRATASAGPRAARGTPEETRARLVAAAGAAFEHDGYFGTDTNRIAKAAGYAPGTFYKHFADKAEIFVAVYEAWIAREWDGVAAIVADARTPTEKAARIADAVLEHHRAWPGLRASLRALVATEPAIRRAHRASRRTQMTRMAELGLDDVGKNAIFLLTVERIADAIADGELRELGMADDEARGRLVAVIEDRLRGR